MWPCKRPRTFAAQVQLQPRLCVPTLLPSHPGARLASPERCGEGVLSAPKADGSGASSTLPQASPARISARIPLLLPHPHGLGQTSASRPPSFDQYRASSQGGCRPHPPRRPQLSQGHMGEGLQPGSGALGGGAGQKRAGKAGITHRVIYSFTHSLFHSHLFSPQIFSEHQLCTRPVIGSGDTIRTR